MLSFPKTTTDAKINKIRFGPRYMMNSKLVEGQRMEAPDCPHQNSIAEVRPLTLRSVTMLATICRYCSSHRFSE